MSKTDISIPQLRVMLAVVEQGSFTAAAEALGMTQSGVSQAIATLEAALGVPLLRRDRAGVATTEVGDRVLGHARAVLAGVDRIRQEAASAVGLERGKIRVGSFASFAARLLPGIIKAFATRHPGIELVLLEGSDAEVRGWLASRIIDVAAVTLPTEGVDVVAETRDEMVVVVPARHRLAGRESVALREIAGEPFVMPVGGCETLIQPLMRAAECPLNVRYEVRDSNTNLTMVAEGLGVSIFPALALPDRMKGLRTVRLDPPAWRRIGLAVNPGDAQVPAVSAFLREAVRQLAASSSEAAA